MSARAASRLWSSGRAALTVPDGPSAFEQKVKRLGLANSPERWPESVALRAWVKGNKNHRYVPEWLLLEMNLMGFYEGE
jgi:hypothetical protein